MKILNSNKEAQKYRVKQAVKFILLSAFFISCFFLLGMVLYKLNSDSASNVSEKDSQNINNPLSLREVSFLYDETAVEKVVEVTKPIAYPLHEVIEPPSDSKKIIQEETEGAKLFYQKLAEIEAQQLAREEDSDIEMSQEELDKLYEEKLPDNVIVENWEDEELTPEQIAEGYHIYNRHQDVKSLNIIPKYKPAYFGEEPVIAIVIDDMGIAKKRTADIISLQAPITASFLTYGNKLQEQISAAEAAGMEIMLHVPMEPYSKADIAPDVLTTEMSAAELEVRFKEMLSKFPKVKGINNHMGSKFTENRESMSAIMKILQEKGLFFLDSKTTAHSVGKETAEDYGVSYATRHVFIDNENKVEYVLKQLEIAEKIARKNGYAVAIGHPKSGTYEALKQWLPSLQDKKIKILPMSDIVKVLHKSHI